MYRSWTLICVLAAVSCLISACIYLVHVPDFFIGDDFELAGDALTGASPLQPMGSHLRPASRLHFLLYRPLPSSSVFGALSLTLHLIASGAVFLALHGIYGRRVALPVALLFFSSFLANEAVFWAASAAVIYCMIFSGLALWCFVRERLVVSYVCLALAALCYEVWLVVPLLFLFHYRRVRELVPPFAMVAVYLGIHLAFFGASGVSSYGGFSVDGFPLRFSIYAFRLLSPLAGSPGLPLSLLLSAALLSLLAVRRFRFSAVLYTASAVLFSLSAQVSSRSGASDGAWKRLGGPVQARLRPQRGSRRDDLSRRCDPHGVVGPEEAAAGSQLFWNEDRGWTRGRAFHLLLSRRSSLSDRHVASGRPHRIARFGLPDALSGRRERHSHVERAQELLRPQWLGGFDYGAGPI